jgi:hypothetical protein
MKNKNGDVVIRSFECYDWFEIENFFATEIGTTPENFVDLGRYCKGIGDFKSFCNVWNELIGHDITTNLCMKYFLDDFMSRKDYIIRKYGVWVAPLFDAIEKMKKTVGNRIFIRYTWSSPRYI